MNKYKVGDHVVVMWGDLQNLNPECWGISFIAHLEQPKGNFYKGEITNIKTHKWFGFIELKNPIYCINYSFITTKAKPLITVRACL